MTDGNDVHIVALICLACVEVIALMLGYDGAILAAVVAAFAGVAGFKIKEAKVHAKAVTAGIKSAATKAAQK